MSIFSFRSLRVLSTLLTISYLAVLNPAVALSEDTEWVDPELLEFMEDTSEGGDLWGLLGAPPSNCPACKCVEAGKGNTLPPGQDIGSHDDDGDGSKLTGPFEWLNRCWESVGGNTNYSCSIAAPTCEAGKPAAEVKCFAKSTGGVQNKKKPIMPAPDDCYIKGEGEIDSTRKYCEKYCDACLDCKATKKNNKTAVCCGREFSKSCLSKCNKLLLATFGGESNLALPACGVECDKCGDRPVTVPPQCKTLADCEGVPKRHGLPWLACDPASCSCSTNSPKPPA